MEMKEVPVTIIIFNRPETTRMVFEQVKKVCPKKIFIISDEGRNEKEKEIVRETRRIVEDINWTCEIHKNYAEQNMGCGYRVSSGLDWVFNHTEFSIILEDDCVPNRSFFEFCAEMLEKYRNDERIMYISGNNFHKQVQFSHSYDFVNIGWIWGWATWRRAWRKYDFKISSWKDGNKNKIHRRFYTDKEYPIFENDLRSLMDRGFFTWDFQWQYACACNNGMCIVPCRNLITNIGFGEEATHTKTRREYYDGKTFELDFPLSDPEFIIPNREYDYMTLVHLKGFESNTIKRNLQKVRMEIARQRHKVMRCRYEKK